MFLLDLTGYIASGASTAPGATVATTPARVLDTAAGVGARKGPLRAGGRLVVKFTGRGRIPAKGVSGVWVQVKVASPHRPGYVVAWPAGKPRPVASTVSFAAGQTVENEVFLPLSSTGKASFANRSGGAIRLVGDVVGYSRAGRVTTEGGLTAIGPRRVADTHIGLGMPGMRYPTITFQVAGRGGVPLTGARAVLLNVTATSAKKRGFLNVYAGRYCIPPMMSRLNFAPGRDIANMILVPLAPDGTITISSTEAVRIIADVSGVVLGPQAPTAGVVSISNGTVGGGPSLSHDGRYVAYGSYIWDSRTRATTALPVPGGTPGCDYGGESLGQGNAVLSGDGQKALYFLPTSVMSNSSNPMYLWNRSDGTTQFITSEYLDSVSITDDGKYVVYAPDNGITDFVEPPTQLIRWNRMTDEKEVLVSVPEDHTIGGGPINQDGHTIIYQVNGGGVSKNFRWRDGQSESLPDGAIRSISADGNTLIYEVDDHPNDPGPVEVFRWRDGQSQLLARGGFQAVSDDGNTVLLNTATPDGLQLKDLAMSSNGTLTRLAPKPVAGYLSGDGRVAVWQQPASSNPDGPWVVYRKEIGRTAAQIIRYPSSARAGGFALSEDGSRLAYANGSGVFLR